jgi:hypothetical protein
LEDRKNGLIILKPFAERMKRDFIAKPKGLLILKIKVLLHLLECLTADDKIITKAVSFKDKSLYGTNVTIVCKLSETDF